MLKFKEVTICYKNEKAILKKISFSLKEGENVFLIGSSGAGKSTLFSSISFPKMIREGTIIINEKNIKELSHRKHMKLLRDEFSFISQNVSLIEDKTVFSNVFRVSNIENKMLKFFGISTNKTTNIIMNALKKVGLFEKAFTIVSDLSGGQKKRVQIAISLLDKPRFIIADEPASSLDVETSKKIIQLLTSGNSTSIISMHKLDLIPRKSRIIAIKKGKIVYDGIVDEISKKDMLKVFSEEKNEKNNI